MVTGVNNCATFSACEYSQCRDWDMLLAMMGGSVKDARMVMLSLTPNKKKLFVGSGLGSPFPNMRANALSFKTLNVILAHELPKNFGYNGLLALRSQTASIELAMI